MRRSGIDVVRWYILICILYTVLDEVHQFFVPNSNPGVKDILINSTEVAVGIFVHLGLSRIRLIGSCKS